VQLVAFAFWGICLGSFTRAAPAGLLGDTRDSDLEDLGEDRLYADDPSLDQAWLQRAKRRGVADAVLSSAHATSAMAQKEASMAGIEVDFAKADATNADVAVQNAKAKLKDAKARQRKAAHTATLDSITHDNVEKRGIRTIVKMDSDATAPDSKGFLTPAREQENDSIMHEMHEDIATTEEREHDSDEKEAVAARQVRIAKGELQDAAEDKMVVDSMLVDAKRGWSKAAAHAARSEHRAEDLADTARVQDAALPKPSEWEDVGSYATDDEGNLVRVRHQREDSSGMRNIYTLVGKHMATVKVSEEDAVALEPEHFQLLSSMTSGTDDVDALSKSSSPQGVDAESNEATEGSKEDSKEDSSELLEHPELGAAESTSVLPVQRLRADLGEAENSVAKDRRRHETVDQALTKISAITHLLNKKATDANQALDNDLTTSEGSTLHRVQRLAGKLGNGAARIMKLDRAVGQHADLRSATPSFNDDGNEASSETGYGVGSGSGRPQDLSTAHRQIAELQAKLVESNAENKEQQKRLDIMLANQGPNEETAQRIASKWADKHFAEWSDDAKQFTVKLMSLKKEAERKQLARVSTAAWMAQEKVVDETADDLRMGNYKAERAVQQFVESRERAADTTELRQVLKKKTLYAKQDFEGYGPKMSEERASASASARKLARDRKDAKSHYEQLDNQLQVTIGRELDYYKDQSNFAYQMLGHMQKMLNIQKQHYEEKLSAAQYRLDAEISQRTSCSMVQGLLQKAAEECKCKQLADWNSAVGHDKTRVELVIAESENQQCKRDVELCKIGYRKAGLVYSAPARNGTFLEYAKTGVVPSADYNVSTAPEMLNPKTLADLVEIQKNPDELISRKASAETSDKSSSR